MNDRRHDAMRVLIVGGGIAGLEALIGLRQLAGDRVDITLLAPELEFTYKPMTVEEPFSFTPAERHELAPIASEFDARFVQAALATMRPDDHLAEVSDGSEVEYDAAIVCVGARQRAAFEGAATLRTSGDPLPIDDLLRAAAEHPSGRIAFVVPPGVSWPLPIYELALMAHRRAGDLGVRVHPLVVTPESAPLIMFGRVPSDSVAALLAGRGIETRPSVHAREGDEGEIVLAPGDERLDAGAVVALPLLEGPRLAGLPADDGGFIPIDEHARVKSADDVHAAGDGANFPIKQGGIGTQQADAAVEWIAARAGAEIEPRPFHPILRGKLITGEETLSMRADLTGGAGEGKASADYLWWPPHKVSGRYLAAWLAGETPHAEPEPPRRPVDIELELPHEWHREPMALDPYGPLDVD
jgi:sulfide:quinone oxidoreductase